MSQNVSDTPPGLHRNSMPDDWAPPAPAWMSDLTQLGRAAVGYFGLQNSQQPDVASFRSIAGLVGSAAQKVEYACYRDAASVVNAVVIAYWKNAGQCHSWAADEQTRRQWRDIVDGAGRQGLWRETMEVPAERLETLFSADDDPVGFARLGEGWFGPIEEHGYWGAMRDRIPLSGRDQMNSGLAAAGMARDSDWLRVEVPHNLCVIRSGQNPTRCQGTELELYRRDVFPRLTEGMEYLRDSGRDIGCVSCRFLEETDDQSRSIGRTFGLAYFTSMADLERWAHSHPTHEAIFGEFLKFAETFGAGMRLRLWHEVFVLDANDRHCFEYLNCHPNTGLLPLIE